jgi:hypothetical protein
MTGYVIDDLALLSGLTGRGSERDRREMSRRWRRIVTVDPSRYGGLGVDVVML